MPSIENWSFKPLEIIQNIFDNHKEASWVEQVEEYFSKRLKNCCIKKTIQSLNDIPLHNLQSETLVYFRCMIQQTFEPEYYVESFDMVNKSNGDKISRLSAFKDSIECPDEFELVESMPHKTSCRQVLYCVTIPGETTWVKEMYHCKEQNKFSSDVGTSRIRTEKRSHESDDESMEQDEQLFNSIDQNKRLRSSIRQENKQNSSLLKKNHPLPEEDGPVCIVKVYGEERDFKVNEIYEFVGVLSLDPSLAQLENAIDQGVDMMEERQAHNPPSSFVPRLHCVYMNKLKHNNPLLYSPEVSLDIMRLTIKNEIKAHLQKATLGDELAAEYLLVHLVSRVYTRSGSMAVGKFSLNISNVSFHNNYTTLLEKFLRQLLTKMFFLTMTLENLNKLTFIPTKNYSTNQLDSGILQLADGTNLVVDETALLPGQLDSNGVKHVQALSSLINFQRVDYDFQFHPLAFNHDIPVLILSDGKSLLPCDSQVPLAPIDVPENLERYFLNIQVSDELLDKFRVYLTQVRLCDYELNEDMMKVVENDFVSARQQRDERMTADDLHLHLVLARLFSISSGLDHLTLDTWNVVRHLERNRKKRFR